MHDDYYGALQLQWFWEFNPEHKAIRWLRPQQVNYMLFINHQNICIPWNYFAVNTHLTFQNVQRYHLMGKCPKFQLFLKMDCASTRKYLWCLFLSEKRSETSETICMFGHSRNNGKEDFRAGIMKGFSRIFGTGQVRACCTLLKFH